MAIIGFVCDNSMPIHLRGGEIRTMQPMRSVYMDRNKRLTSLLNLLDAHVYYHGPRGIVCFHQGGKVAAVYFLDALQIWLAVIGHVFGTLFMYIQSAV